MAVRWAVLFDQADLADVADAHGVSAAVCGYAATVLATHLKTRPAPATGDDFAALVDELQASAIELMRLLGRSRATRRSRTLRPAVRCASACLLYVRVRRTACLVEQH